MSLVQRRNGGLSVRDYRRMAAVASRYAPGAYRASKYFAKKAYETYQKHKKRRRRTRATGGTVHNSEFKPSSSRYRRLPPRKKSLKKRISAIEKTLRNYETTYIKKELSSDRCLSLTNESCYINYIGNSRSLIEGAIDALPVFNPSTPDTYTTMNFTSGTNTKKCVIKGDSLLTIQNNYNAPAVVTIYYCEPKGDNSLTAHQAYTNGLNDQATGLDSSSILMYPTDISQFNLLYSIKKTVKKTLEAGGRMWCRHYGKWVEYDPAFRDHHTTEYTKDMDSHHYLIRISGVLCHDTTLDQQAIGAAGIDIGLFRKHTVKYDGGVRMTRYEHVTTLDGITNAEESNAADYSKTGYSLA